MRRPFAVAAVLTIAITSCASSGGSASSDSALRTDVERSETQNQAETEASASTIPTAAAAAESRRESSAANPLPLVDATFTFDDPSHEAFFDGVILGMVEAPLSNLAEEPGRCYIVLGSMTPLRSEYTLSDQTWAPRVSLVVDDASTEPAIGDCDSTEVEDAGYAWILRASVSVGTSYDFFESFFVADSAGVPTAIAVSTQPYDEGLEYFIANVATDVPPPPPPSYGSTEFMESAAPMTDSTITFVQSFSGTTWEVDLVALVESDIRPTSEADGFCVYLLGSITLVDVEADPTFDSTSIPGTFLIVDGRSTPTVGGACDNRVIEAGGWSWSITADVSIGNQVDFYDSFFLRSDRPNMINAVGIGVPASDNAQIFVPAPIQNNVPRAS